MAEATPKVVKNTTIPGVYSIMFRGFERELTGKRGRHLVGLGRLTLSDTGAVKLTGTHKATNSPMMGPGSVSHDYDRRHAEYGLTGDYTVVDDGTTGNPIELLVTVTFTENKANGRKMEDKFVVMQCGPDRFWLVSTEPMDTAGGGRKPVDELVYGEAVKVTTAW